MPIPEVDKIWFNGELVPWGEAKVHVLTHALHYGSGVFEGIRCYTTPKGPAVFRLEEHLKRLERSAKLYYMPVPYTVAELYDRIAACRAQGFATVDAEFEPGLVGVAAPIRDFGRTIVAAINLSAPGFRFASRLNEAGAELRSATDALSALLGAFRAGG